VLKRAFSAWAFRGISRGVLGLLAVTAFSLQASA
jgi:hypothetical protein